MKKEVKGYKYYNKKGKLVKVNKYNRECKNQFTKLKKKKK